MDIEGWKVIDEDAGILWREYAFSKTGRATALVFRGKDGLVVVSPPAPMDARAYDALAQFGEVRALVANNTFHHMGQKPWRERFPQAESYCPPNAVAKLEKKVAGVKLRPLTDLALGEGAHWEDVPGFKTGEAILTVNAKQGAVWFVGDLLVNIPRLPPPPLRWLFTWTDSGPGFRLFKPAVWLAVRDKQAVRTWMLDHLAKSPPAVVVTSHGPAVEMPGLADEARKQVERL